MRDLINLMEGRVTTFDHLLRWQSQLREVHHAMDRFQRENGQYEKLNDIQDCIWQVTEILDAYANREEAKREERRKQAEKEDEELYGRPNSDD